MKNLLNYQSSEYDCGPTSVTNAIRFLYEREEIYPMLLKQIWTMGNDAFGDDGRPGCRGTSRASMRYMADWLNGYGEHCHFPIRADFAEKEDAEITEGSKSLQCLRQGGCVVMRCYTGRIGHYVLLTQLLPDGEIGLFDPYEEEPEFTEPGRRVIEGQPRVMNRAVRLPLFNLTQEEADYAMGPVETRENLLLWRNESRKQETDKQS